MFRLIRDVRLTLAVQAVAFAAFLWLGLIFAARIIRPASQAPAPAIAAVGSPTPSATYTLRPPPTHTPSATITNTPLPSVTPLPSWTPTVTDTPWPTVTPTPRPTPTPTPYRDPLQAAPPLDVDSIVPWDGSRSVTVLLMGVDRRPSQGGQTRTDTMLLVRLDPSSDRAGMVSIPRDLYVPIPGYGTRRINSAHVFGGPPLAVQTVSENLSVHVDNYAVVDFVAFTTLVDEMGGIDIDVPVAINDPYYPDHFYGYDPLYIAPGFHHMDGTTALKYARSRHGSSDFERARRQQAVLLAVRDTLVRLDRLPHMLTRAPGLYAILASSIDTNLPFDQIVSLAVAAADVPAENIQHAVIDGNYVSSYVTSDGSQVLLPNTPAIRALVVQTLP